MLLISLKSNFKLASSRWSLSVAFCSCWKKSRFQKSSKDIVITLTKRNLVLMLELFQEQKQKKFLPVKSIPCASPVWHLWQSELLLLYIADRQCCVFCGNLINYFFFFSFFFFVFFFVFFSIGQVWFFLPGINISVRNPYYQSNVYLSQTAYNCKQD